MYILFFWYRSLHRVIGLQNVHEVFNGWQVLQAVDGWLGGSGKLSWLRSCEVSSTYCWKMFSQVNLKGKCKASGFFGGDLKLFEGE